jgi:ABC-2 type transport system permease protein
MKLFIFEWKKLMKRKTTWVLLLLSTLAIIGAYFFHLHLTENVQTKVVNHYDRLTQIYLQDMEEWSLEKERAIEAEDEGMAEEAAMLEESSRFSHERYQELRDAYVNEEWDVLYQNDIEYLEIFAYPPPGEPASYNFEDHEISNFTLRASLEERKYMLEHEIDPFIQSTTSNMMLSTVYEDFFTERTQELWEEETSRYGREGSYFIYQLIQLLFIPMVVLLGCFIFGNTLSSDVIKKTNAFRFYQVLPLNQSKLFLAKYVTGYVGVLLFILLMLAVPVGLGSIVHGFGDLDYPILVYDGYSSEFMEVNAEEDTFHFITLQEYLTQTLVFAVAISLFIYSIYFLIAQFSKEPILNVIVTGIITYGGTLLTHPYNPFSYLDIDQVMTNEIQLQTWSTAFTYSTGITVTFITAIMMVVLNFFIYKFKTVRI